MRWRRARAVSLDGAYEHFTARRCQPERAPAFLLWLAPTYDDRRPIISAPVIQPPDWSLPLEIRCDANAYAFGAVLAQTK